MSAPTSRPPGRPRGSRGDRQLASDSSTQTADAPTPFSQASPEARRLAAAILEVLAGTQMPSEAARSLGLSLARYYQLELRAVAGLVAGCEGRRRGRGSPPGDGIADLRRECERLRRECARQQALVRAARRTVGLVPPPPPAELPKKRRRPTARALKMAALLRPDAANAPAPAAEEVTSATTIDPAETATAGPTGNPGE
jgi:hypothetical protein